MNKTHAAALCPEELEDALLRLPMPVIINLSMDEAGLRLALVLGEDEVLLFMFFFFLGGATFFFLGICFIYSLVLLHLRGERDWKTV